jgi:hypothetical protein
MDFGLAFHDGAHSLEETLEVFGRGVVLHRFVILIPFKKEEGVGVVDGPVHNVHETTGVFQHLLLQLEKFRFELFGLAFLDLDESRDNYHIFFPLISSLLTILTPLDDKAISMTE